MVVFEKATFFIFLFKYSRARKFLNSLQPSNTLILDTENNKKDINIKFFLK